MKIFRSLIVILSLLILVPASWAGEIPNYRGDIYVQDLANVLSPQIEQEIIQKAKELEDLTTAQIVVATVNSLDNVDIETYSNQLFRQWGIGDKEKENRVLLLVALEGKQFRIEVGYGLEGRINDAKAGDILRSITP